MMRRFFSHRVAWLALLVSLGIGALFAHTMWSMRTEHWAHQLRTNANLSSTLAKGLEWSLDAVDLSLQKTAIALNEAQQLDESGEHATSRALLKSLWLDAGNSDFLVLDRQGRVVRRAHRMRDTDQQFAQHDFFLAFVQHQHSGVFIGQPTKGLRAGEYVLPVARAVRGKYGAFNGVVVGMLSMQDINAWLATMDLGTDSGVNVIREDGLVLTRFPYLETPTPHTLAGSSNLAQFFAVPQGYFVGTAVIDGVERLYTHHRVGHFPVVVNVAQSTRTIFQAWRSNAWLLGAFAALLMLSCLGLSVMFVRELMRREATETDLFTEKERMSLTLQSISDAVMCTDAQGRITYLNPVATQVTGVALEDVVNQAIEVLHPVVRPASAEWTSPLRRALENRQVVERTRIRVLHSGSGAELEMEESVSLVKAADGAVQGAVAVLRDVTLAAAQEAHMQRLAFHDVLTGLPNRTLLQDRAQQAMAHSRRTGDILAVLYMDLDGFKQINDSLGHQAGDAALVHIAKVLQACVRESDTVCRLGGDEFVVLLCELTSAQHLQKIAQKIQQACATPLVWQGQTHVLHVSGGIALYPAHAMQWDALLHCADTAMYTAKQSGRRQIRLFQPKGEASVLAHAQSQPQPQPQAVPPQTA